MKLCFLKKMNCSSQDVHLVRVDVLRLLDRGADGEVHQARARGFEARVLLQRVRKEGVVQRQEPLRQQRKENPIQRRRQQSKASMIVLKNLLISS